MTRAARLLMAGDVAGSLRIHPLLIPNVLATAAVVLAVVWATYSMGWPHEVWRRPWGKAVVAGFAMVQIAVLALWVLRFLGWFGGPVPV